jgi:hypothetical protein
MKPTAVMKPKPMQPRKKTTSTKKFSKKVAMTSSPDDVHATGMTYAELVLMTGSQDTVHSTIPAIVAAKTMMMTTPKIHAFDQPMCLTATHVPCGGFFIATVDVVVFKLVFCGRLVALAVDSSLPQLLLLLSSKLSSTIGLSFLAVDSSLRQWLCRLRTCLQRSGCRSLR